MKLSQNDKIILHETKGTMKKHKFNKAYSNVFCGMEKYFACLGDIDHVSHLEPPSICMLYVVSVYERYHSTKLFQYYHEFRFSGVKLT